MSGGVVDSAPRVGSEADVVRARLLEVVRWKRVIEAAKAWREVARTYRGIDHFEADLIAAVDALSSSMTGSAAASRDGG